MKGKDVQVDLNWYSKARWNKMSSKSVLRSCYFLQACSVMFPTGSESSNEAKQQDGADTVSLRIQLS